MTRRVTRTVIGAGAALAIAIFVLLYLRHGYESVENGPDERAALDALDHPKTVEIFRLANEVHPGMEDAMPPGTVFFRGYQVSGYKVAKDARRMADAVKDGLTKEGQVRACFEPHHAVRVRTDQAVFDFLISYRCQQTVVYLGKEKVAVLPTRDVQAELEEAYDRSGL